MDIDRAHYCLHNVHRFSYNTQPPGYLVESWDSLQLTTRKWWDSGSWTCVQVTHSLFTYSVISTSQIQMAVPQTGAARVYYRVENEGQKLPWELPHSDEHISYRKPQFCSSPGIWGLFYFDIIKGTASVLLVTRVKYKIIKRLLIRPWIFKNQTLEEKWSLETTHRIKTSGIWVKTPER